MPLNLRNLIATSKIFVLNRKGKLVRFLRDTLLNNSYFTNTVYGELSPTGSQPGILYGLPKVHKNDCPARPIFSAIGTYNYNIAKFIVPILQPYTTNIYTVKDNFAFVSEITSFENHNARVMAILMFPAFLRMVPSMKALKYACRCYLMNQIPSDIRVARLGGYMTCGWTGVCRPVFRRVPSSNYRNLRSYPLS